MNCEKGCNCVHKATGTEQTLDELDWERGIWGRAANGDLDKLKTKIKDLNSQDRYGYTALHYACRNNQVQIVRFLLSCPDICLNHKTNGGATPLHRAAMSKMTNSLELLLSNSSCEPMHTDDEGQNFLHKLARSQSQSTFTSYLSNPKYALLASQKDKYGKLPSDYST